MNLLTNVVKHRVHGNGGNRFGPVSLELSDEPGINSKRCYRDETVHHVNERFRIDKQLYEVLGDENNCRHTIHTINIVILCRLFKDHFIIILPFITLILCREFRYLSPHIKYLKLLTYLHCGS